MIAKKKIIKKKKLSNTIEIESENLDIFELINGSLYSKIQFSFKEKNDFS